MPDMKIPAKLLPLIQVKKRFKIIIGGRGSAKSQTVADIALMEAQTQRLKIACFREFQNSIDDSVLSLLNEEITRLDLRGFREVNNSIEHVYGGVFKFKGLSRNPDSMKSMHGFKRFIVEEAQSLSEESIELLTPTMRADDGEVWLIANPMSSADPFSKRFILPFLKEIERDGYYEDELHLVIKVNWRDNPFFPEALNQERLWDYAHKPRAEYDHVWEGAFNDSVPNSIITPDWFDAAIDAHIKLGFKPRGIKVLAHDPADMGKDPKAYAIRHGSVFIDVQQSKDGDVNDACDWALDAGIAARVDVFTWDCDGLGASLRRQVAQAVNGKQIDWQMFKGSESVDNPTHIYQPTERQESVHQRRTNEDTFRNKRAQYYWMLRDRFYKTWLAVVRDEYIDPEELISLSSKIQDMQQLRSEVCRIPKKPSGNGYIQIMSKAEMLAMKPPIPSPNMADCLMMSLFTPSVKAKKRDDYSQVMPSYGVLDAEAGY